MTKKQQDAERADLMRLVPELPVLVTESTTIGEFLTSLIPFARKAQQLEQRAEETFIVAKALAQPKNADDDTRLQLFIKQVAADVKEVDTHWNVTSLIFQFQRRLVAVRDRAGKKLDQSKAHAQQLHNEYLRLERQRVEEENRRRQEEADRLAREERERVLAELEEQALKAEATSPDLSRREELFIFEYLGLVAQGIQANAPKQAAMRAGYKDASIGARLLERPKIQAAIKARHHANAIRQQASATKAAPVVADQVLEETVQKGSGGSDRTLKSAEVIDKAALIQAIVAGEVPLDLLQIDTVRLNQYARELGKLIAHWPGVRYAERTITV
jgi:hypothetical protein